MLLGVSIHTYQMSKILIYGAYGFVGREISRLAKEKGLNPVLAGRNKEKTQKIAAALALEHIVFSLSDSTKVEQCVRDFDILMNCAGPYIDTFKPLVSACIIHNTHYLDLSGEIPVYEKIFEMGSAYPGESKAMILPGIGFDVAPTDCLALHLKEHFDSGSKLMIAFKSSGPAGLPPGTMKTMVTLIPFGLRIRKEGKLIRPGKALRSRKIKFSSTFNKALRISWGDIFTAYHSTGIPNIEVYASFSKMVMLQLRLIYLLRPLLSSPWILRQMRKVVKGGSNAKQREKTKMLIYAELSNDEGKKAICRMTGPEGGFIWTSNLAIEALKMIKSGIYKPGYQTPASAFGAAFGLQIEGVSRSEIEYE